MVTLANNSDTRSKVEKRRTTSTQNTINFSMATVYSTDKHAVGVSGYSYLSQTSLDHFYRLPYFLTRLNLPLHCGIGLVQFPVA